MKRISTKRTGFLRPALLAMSITLLGACASEEEAIDDNNKSEKVTVRFTVSEQPFGATQTVAARSASNPTSEATSDTTDESIVEEKLTHVSGDLYARTTLVETASPATRATTALADNKKVRILAYTATTNTLLSYADYKMADGQLVADGTPPLSLAAGTYDFVAYSYNSTTLPAHDATSISGISSSATDLLYVRKNGVSVSANAADIFLTLAHLFAKVQVKISTAQLDQSPVVPNITAIGSSTLPTGYSGASLSLDVSAGTLSGGAETVLSFPALGQTTVESDVAYVYPNAATAKLALSVSTMSIAGVSVHSGGISGTTGYYYGAEADGTTTLLQANHSYTLTIDFTYLRFADSNIYWDGNKLAFYEHGTLTGDAGDDNDAAKKRMQGVYFKFGSLVGVAAAPSAWSVGTNGSTDGTPLYFHDGSQWKNMNLTTARASYPSAFTAANWMGIPYVNASLTVLPFVSRRSDDLQRWKQLSEANAADGFRGDICRKLSETMTDKYRLPVSAEFAALSEANFTRWDAPATGAWTGQSPTNSAGMDLITNYRKTAGGLVLPASGYRDGAGGSLSFMGTYNAYCSSTVHTSATKAYDLFFMYNAVYPAYSEPRMTGFSVRCLKIN